MQLNATTTITGKAVPKTATTKSSAHANSESPKHAFSAPTFFAPISGRHSMLHLTNLVTPADEAIDPKPEHRQHPFVRGWLYSSHWYKAFDETYKRHRHRCLHRGVVAACELLKVPELLSVAKTVPGNLRYLFERYGHRDQDFVFTFME